MKYKPMVNIWKLTHEEIEKLQPGQWVQAGEGGNKGVFCGVKPSGTVVVAWHSNAKASGSYVDYLKTLNTYAKGRS